MSKLHLKKFKERPLSWSSLSSWEWSKDQWSKKYLDSIEGVPGPELLFGKALADSIEDGTCKVPGLLDILELKKEHEFKCNLGKIVLIGYADAFDDKTFKVLHEVKSGVLEFNKKRVDSMLQLDMYLLMNFIINKVKPEDVKVKVFWIPTVKIEKDNGDFSGSDYEIKFKEPIEVKVFETKRTLKDILKFSAYIKSTHANMLKFACEYVGKVV